MYSRVLVKPINQSTTAANKLAIEFDQINLVIYTAKFETFLFDQVFKKQDVLSFIKFI